MSENLEKIILAVDLGYSPQKVAVAYVAQFNKTSRVMILDWEIRDPIEDEVNEPTERRGKKLLITRKGPTGDIMKRVFVLVVKKYQTIPEEIYRARMEKLQIEPIEVEKEELK